MKYRAERRKKKRAVYGDRAILVTTIMAGTILLLLYWGVM